MTTNLLDGRVESRFEVDLTAVLPSLLDLYPFCVFHSVSEPT